MPASDSSTLRLLCIDADDDARAVLELSLELDPQFEVVGVSSLQGAEEALSAGAQADAIIVAAQLLIADPASPRALCKIAQRWDAPVIVTFDEPGFKADLMRSPVAEVVIEYIARPFDPLILADEVRLLLSSAAGSRIRQR